MIQLPEPNVIADLGACWVVNKPGGVLTQGPPGLDSLELRIKQFVKVRDNKPGKVYLGVPHRLDRPASGVMLFARNVRAAQRIAKQFQARTVQKTYWAIVENHVRPDSGTWIDHMKKLPDEAKSVIADEHDTQSQEAILDFEVVARNANQTWLKINLRTGRTHQIRLQCSHRGHPILGDQLYQAGEAFGPDSQDVRKRWIALHAREIEFEHPIEHRRYKMQAPLWSHWRQLEFEFGSDNVEP